MNSKQNYHHPYDVVDEIENVRRKNNVIWMDIIRVAIKWAPHEVKELLRQIEKNDREVTRLCQSLQELLPD